MSIHAPDHWCLLVCDLKRCVWDFYDSMPLGRHQASLPGLVCFGFFSLLYCLSYLISYYLLY
ncbi:hypothetical protein KSP40_PGU006089 [Platanthera guangdongensis]|uniref:Ubiquitin-like protease family profile domain-containing protein n=1 Tax=Platanthera guangdongensis TaxID=2320717 RepID=A0ABR2LMP7_9ASPA